MLFSYENPTSQNPYYASIEEMPWYQREKKIEKREAIEGGAFGALFQAAASMVPIVGGAIGKIGAGGINQSLQNRHNDANDYFKSELAGQSHNTDATGGLSGMSGGVNNLTQNKGLMQYLQKEMQKNRDNAFSQTALNDGLQSTSQFDKFTPATENTPNVPDINPSQQIDLTSGGGSSNFDFSSFGGGGIVAPAMAGFYRGGLAPLGKDDIALIDTKNGNDTGVRLQAGEMLVVSKDNLASLHKALNDKDHKGVFDIMKHQVNVAPTVKDGKKGHAGGGSGTAQGDAKDGDIVTLDTEQYIRKDGKWFNYVNKKVGSPVTTGASNIDEAYKKQGAYTTQAAIENTPAPQKEEGGGTFGWEKFLGAGKPTDSKSADKDYGKFGKKVSQLSDEQFAALAAHNIQNKLTGMTDLVNQEAEKRGLKIEGGILNPVSVVKDGKPIAPDASFDATKFTTSSQGFPFAPKVAETSKPTETAAPVADQKIEDSYTAPAKPAATDTDISDKFAPARPETDAPSMVNAQDEQDQPDLNKRPVPAIQGTYEPEGTQGATATDYAKFYAPQALGTGFDVARGVLGFSAANKPLPTFTKPQAWNEYVNRLHGLSETGLTGNEMTAAQRGIDQTYAYDVNNIRDLSGGNSGMALGNLGRAASQHYAAQTNLAALNDEARARNLGQYGGALSEDVNLNRMIFGDKYNEAMYTKQAGGQLAHDAISNIQQRGQYMQEYAPGTPYDQINQLNLQGAKDTNANTQAMQKYYATHGFTSPPVSSTSNNAPSYQDYAAYKKWLATQGQ